MVGNDAVGRWDYLGLAIVTDDKNEKYRDKIKAALEKVTGATLKWVKYTGSATCKGFKKKEGFRLEKVKDGTIKGNWDRVKDAIEKDSPLYVIAQTLVTGEKQVASHKDACCHGRRVTITENTDPQIPLEDGKDETGKRKWKVGSSGWEWTLWHELVGHGIEGHDHYHNRKNSHSTNPDADPEEANMKKAPDRPDWIENEGRRIWNKHHPNNPVPLRRPTHHDRSENEIEKDRR
jgi:hypothetical protein